MRLALNLTRLWPGLTSLWLQGRWMGLALAAAFAVSLNSALVITFVWPQVLSPDLPAWVCPSAAWVTVLWFWIAGFRSGSRLLAATTSSDPVRAVEADKLLRDAQVEYLKGNWIEVEALLARLLLRQPDDAEAMLLQTTLHRRMGRLEKARKSLARMAESEHADRWQHEIADERRRVHQLEHTTTAMNDQSRSRESARAA